MKPVMLFTIVLMAAIILAASFGLHIMPTESLFNLSPETAASTLYLCPAADSVWDSIAAGLRGGLRYINMFFFFSAFLLVFGWMWALYQNLLKDKFEKKAFDNTWGFTKAWFWAIIIVAVLVATPNRFRSVSVAGSDERWVLCEENNPGAVTFPANAVKR